MARDRDVERFRSLWQDEIDSAAVYKAMAEGEKNKAVARVYRDLAAVELKHAGFWRQKLVDKGADPGDANKASWRARVLAFGARRFGASMVLPTVATKEAADRNVYLLHPETSGTRMNAQERAHARVLQALMVQSSRPGKSPGVSGGEVARLEGRHKSASGNALRAAVLGANDGLCSNLALVMGVAGASADRHTILLGGFAGLLAGAFSMALGEWVSVTSARELAEREMGKEREELAEQPEEEREELQLIYEARGLPAEEAKELSKRLVAEPAQALDILTREELGIDPQELGGSPNTAALTSFLLFALGAIFPVAPFFFLEGVAAVVVAVALSGLMLFVIGAAITIFTGKPVWLSGSRQLVLGLVAAGATFALGKLFGTALG